ncbi:hypothetical protein CRUP_027238, partial [Coryphaenoides rupestris]
SPPSSRHSTPTPRETLHPLQGVIVFASFVLAVGVAIVAHRCWTDFWRRKGRSEGGGEPENIQLEDPEQLKANPENTTQYLEWRHGPDLLASWTSGNSNFLKKERRDVFINDQFELCLLHTSVEDSGVYTAFVDSVQTQRIKIFILSPVPVPTVSWDCEDPVAGTPEVLCLVTCEGNTSGAEPESSPPSSRHSTPTPRETLHPLQGVIVFASFVLAVGVAIAIECEDEKSDQPPEPRTEPSGGNIP